jgi:hypothetical protein
MTWLRHLVVLLLAALAVPNTAPPASGIALIVNAQSGLASLSDGDTRAYYLRDRTDLPSGVKAMLTMRPEGSPEKALFLRRVVKMSASEFRRHWAAIIYRGEAIGGPLVLESDASVMRYVARVPGAMGYVRRDAPLVSGITVALVVEASP